MKWLLNQGKLAFQGDNSVTGAEEVLYNSQESVYTLTMSLNDFVLDIVKESQESEDYLKLKEALKELEAPQEEEVYMVTFSSQ